MQVDLGLETLGIALIFVFPGLVSMQVYQMLMPAKEIPWAAALLQGFFYSGVNTVFLYPLIFAFLNNEWSLWANWGLIAVFGLIGPTLWPILVTVLFRWDWVARKINIPYPTSWDYFFDKNHSFFMIIHLKNGSVIGGLWSSNSHAGQYPHNGDLYLEQLYHLDEDGSFAEPVLDTQGLLITKDQYTHIQLFQIPSQAEVQDE